MNRPSLHWHLFCQVIDHYGDAGVCWRLAKSLAQRGQQITLWIDLPERLHPLQEADWQQQFPLLTVQAWSSQAKHQAPNGDVFIEMFACNLRFLPPASAVWINLEYLSAESWVEGCHGLPSPQTQGRKKYFFFPGFSSKTGGLLTDVFRKNSPTQAPTGALPISLFCYDNAALASLLQAFCSSPQPIWLALPSPAMHARVEQTLGTSLTVRREYDALTIAPLPFLTQADYDGLLSDCALNFVRGEDSFAQAQLVGKPLIWQAYIQQNETHFEKLQAWQQCCNSWQTPVLQEFTQCWNRQQSSVQALWPQLLQDREALQKGSQQWAEELLQHDLAENLLDFSIRVNA